MEHVRLVVPADPPPPPSPSPPPPAGGWRMRSGAGLVLLGAAGAVGMALTGWGAGAEAIGWRGVLALPMGLGGALLAADALRRPRWLRRRDAQAGMPPRQERHDPVLDGPGTGEEGDQPRSRASSAALRSSPQA